MTRSGHLAVCVRAFCMFMRPARLLGAGQVVLFAARLFSSQVRMFCAVMQFYGAVGVFVGVGHSGR